MHKVIFCFLAALLTLHSSAQNRKKLQPNVIIIFMDDLGYGDLNAYQKRNYTTPNLDRLAREGMRFTNFYAAQAVCSASRAALLTGCYPNRLGIWAALMPQSPIALDSSETTIASMLKKVGYKTSMVGKWHLGARSPFLPVHYGFDEYLGLPYSNDMWPVYYDGKPVRDSSGNKSKYPPLPLIEGDQPLQYVRTLEEQGMLTKLYTERAVSFINRSGKDKFFLYLAHSMPHVPIYASPQFLGKSGAGLFGDMMMELDWSVGQIIRALEQNGILDNTIIVFTSDNGPWLSFGNHAGSSGGLREGKGTIWEGGVRVPCLIFWKNKLRAGTVCDGLATTMDLLPTLASICGAPLPERKIDGVDISGLIAHPKGESPRKEFVYYYDRNNLKAIRQGYWKLVFPHESQTYLHDWAIGKDGFPGKYGTVKVALSLYNLKQDPTESRDLKDLHPERVQEMSAIAQKYRLMLGDDLTGVKGSENRR